jgi:ligand-binding sensor domain-containing protein/tRNA A-37 threonylcarbamoyl transferase component Bud32
MDILQPGQMLGPYRIISQVGQGGMARVYQAYHAAMDRYVALKVLPSQLAENPEFTGRFQQEARIIARLEHPQILPVHDYGESEGVAYLVMRYLEGGTLKDRLHEHPPSLSEIDHYFGQLAEALAYAHARGVVHRDLKPSNVMVDLHGHLFLTDFGIAKLLEGSSKLTGTGTLMGTPDYMSPEQAQGLKVDQRTDIYSLGIILYEMVTGRVPFEAETPLAVILAHVNAPLPLPSSLKPGLSPAIERVLLKALAKSPDDRFASIDEFHAAWKKAVLEATTLPLAPAPAPAVPPSVPPSAPPPALPAASAEPARAAVPDSTVPLRAASLPAPTPPAAAVRRKLPAAPIAVGAGLLAVVVVGLALFAAAEAWLRPSSLATPRPSATSLGPASPLPVLIVTANPAAATPAPAASSTAVPATAVQVGAGASPTPGVVAAETPGQGPWASWAAMNHAWILAVNGNQLLAGGRSLSVWDRHSGKLVRQYVSPADGLPDALIYAILVGDGGSVWLGTGNGLGFFDGQKWSTFGTTDGLDSSTVSALAWAKDGLLVGTQYCGTDGCGLNLFTQSGAKPVNGFPSVADDKAGKLSPSITTLLTDEAHKIWWVGTTRGLARLDETKQKWTTYFLPDGLPNEAISALMVDPDGTLWVGTGRGAATLKPNAQRFEPVKPLQDTGVLGIVRDSQGRTWFACDGGLERYTPPAGNALGQWQRYTQDDGLPSLSYYTAVGDADGNLYFGSDSGVVQVAGTKFTNWAVPNVPVFGAYSRILPAPDGAPGTALWFVEQYGGPHVDRFDLGKAAWSLVTGLPDGCSPLAVDANRAVWCGGTQGLWVLNLDGSQIHLTSAQGLPSDQVTALVFPAAARGTAWVGTADKGVALYQDQKIVRVLDSHTAGLASNAVHVLLAASDGSLWIGTDQGLDRLSAGQQWTHYTKGQPFDQGLEAVTALAEAPEGAIWVGTLGEGNVVRRWTAGQWQTFAEGTPGARLPHSFIQSIIAAPNGSVWFGSGFNGAARFDGKTWALFGVQDGLIQPSIHDIFIDAQGGVWFATEGGVSRYRP